VRILITGAQGYIGAVLASTLIDRGYEVVGLDVGFYADGCLYDGIACPSALIAKDIRNITREDLEGFDAVVHLAELSNDPMAQHNPTLTFRINHRGTVELAMMCKEIGIPRFVYTSSCSVYGAGHGDMKDEQSETDPQTAYAECKVMVERDLAAMATDNFSPTFLRNATAYGASPRMRFDIVLNNLAGLAWTRKEIIMTSDGSPWRPLVHVRDIAHAIACTLEAPREIVHNQIFNVGSTAHNYRVREIAAVVADTFPDCKLSFGNSDGDNRSYRVCFDKIRANLPGFHCRRTPSEGAMELRQLFQDIQMTRERFEFRGFTRLKQLEYLLRTDQIDRDFFWKGQNSDLAGRPQASDVLQPIS
jgi:nucleoside-diphosphate-sugar epimerase